MFLPVNEIEIVSTSKNIVETLESYPGTMHEFKQIKVVCVFLY